MIAFVAILQVYEDYAEQPEESRVQACYEDSHHHPVQNSGILQLPAVREVTWCIPWPGPGSFASKSISVYQTWIAIIHLDITLSDLLSSYSTIKMGTKM